ncbi:hypothetical protein QBC39DRAFT_34164 [Podospora conica]|nr:hypothetical protein QBC39DRAFT_34164 [Schizothecium conicum]
MLGPCAPRERCKICLQAVKPLCLSCFSSAPGFPRPCRHARSSDHLLDMLGALSTERRCLTAGTWKLFVCSVSSARPASWIRPTPDGLVHPGSPNLSPLPDPAPTAPSCCLLRAREDGPRTRGRGLVHPHRRPGSLDLFRRLRPRCSQRDRRSADDNPWWASKDGQAPEAPRGPDEQTAGEDLDCVEATDLDQGQVGQGKGCDETPGPETNRHRRTLGEARAECRRAVDP